MFTPLKRLWRRTDGNVAIIFALTLVPAVFLAGAAIDFARGSDLAARIQGATDSATLALCKEPATSTPAQLQAKAASLITGMLPDVAVELDPLEVTPDPRKITVRTRAAYDPAFTKIVTNEPLKVAITSECAANDMYYEIALVLDTTGSMASTSGSKSKMESAKDAAAAFVDYMFTTGARPGHVKISIVPFAATVAVDPTTYRNATWIDQTGKSKYHWRNFIDHDDFTNRFGIFAKLKAVNSAWDWKGCFETLGYPLNVSDGKPDSSNPDSYYVPLLAPDEAGNTDSSGDQDSASRDSNNSYMNDGPSSSGSCQSDAATDKRFGQACKYKDPKRIRTSQPGPNWHCTSRPLTRMIADKDKLKAELKLLQPSGSTNIHEGFMWGWRTISPNSVFADGSPAGTVNLTRIIVLMSDGTNQWLTDSGNDLTKSQYSAYGYYKNADGRGPNSRLPSANADPSTDDKKRAAIDALTAAACGNAKKMATIYTVGFSTKGDAIDAKGLKLLNDCASSTDKSFVAADENAIVDAFEKIAKGIGQLRLTQ